MVQPDGKILVAGAFTTINSTNRGGIARLDSNGMVDPSFNPTGGANGASIDLAIQEDGKIVIGGSFTAVNFDLNKRFAARLNSDGSLDSSFAPVFDSTVRAVSLQPDNMILIGGEFQNVNGSQSRGMARLNSNGDSDTSFDLGTGVNGPVNNITLQPDQKIVFAGNFSMTNGHSTLGVGRLEKVPAAASRLFDYDGDGKSDISVFRASENRWYVLRSSDFGSNRRCSPYLATSRRPAILTATARRTWPYSGRRQASGGTAAASIMLRFHSIGVRTAIFHVPAILTATGRPII
jgi:uncharacterized delta-60 repeat protein